MFLCTKHVAGFRWIAAIDHCHWAKDEDTETFGSSPQRPHHLWGQRSGSRGTLAVGLAQQRKIEEIETY
jgi:hypothetical protein